MFKVKILTIGKTKETWLEAALEEYRKRLKSTVQIEFSYVKDNRQLLAIAEKEGSVVGLDPGGIQLSSEAFSQFFVDSLEKRGARMTFVIGGPEGLPQDLKTNHFLLSLSTLTFTHQIARLILVEQIYRAVEINKKSPYHK